MARVRERITKEKNQFTELHTKVKDLLHIQGFFDKLEISQYTLMK